LKKQIFAVALLGSMLLAPAWAGDDIKALLQDYSGKLVTLRLADGGELSGKVGKVGDKLVQLGELSGKEFFDAAVKIEDIEAVIFRAR
jgi:hypothetical protein